MGDVAAAAAAAAPRVPPTSLRSPAAQWDGQPGVGRQVRDEPPSLCRLAAVCVPACLCVRACCNPSPAVPQCPCPSRRVPLRRLFVCVVLSGSRGRPLHGARRRREEWLRLLAAETAVFVVCCYCGQRGTAAAAPSGRPWHATAPSGWPWHAAAPSGRPWHGPARAGWPWPWPGAWLGPRSDRKGQRQW